MRLSIVTINRNNADGLKKTLESVIFQHFNEFEYIIVDGASTDGTIDVLRELEPKTPGLKVVSEPDTGIYNALKGTYPTAYIIKETINYPR